MADLGLIGSLNFGPHDPGLQVYRNTDLTQIHGVARNNEIHSIGHPT
jgi:hypothetical protein